MALEFPSSITVSPFSSPLFEPQAFQTGANPLSEPPAGPGQNLDEIIRKAKGSLFTPGAAADPNQAVLKAAQAAQNGGASIPTGEPTPVAGGGGRVQPGGMGLSPDSAMKAVKSLIDLFKSGPTRGDTGGVSLSDQLRSAGGGAAGGVASALSGSGRIVPAGASQGLSVGGVGGGLEAPLGPGAQSMLDLSNQLLSEFGDSALPWAQGIASGNLGNEILGFGGNTGAGATGAGAGAGAGAGGAASSAGSSFGSALGAGAANAALGLLLKQLGAPPELVTAASMGA